MPNRRDVIFNSPDAYITPVYPTAGNAQLVTSGCYEAFDLHDADDKTDLCQYKNISSDGFTEVLIGKKARYIVAFTNNIVNNQLSITINGVAHTITWHLEHVTTVEQTLDN